LIKNLKRVISPGCPVKGIKNWSVVDTLRDHFSSPYSKNLDLKLTQSLNRFNGYYLDGNY